MNKSLRRRVAAVATTATVGGLLLPFLAAGSAAAATPTSLTVSPTSAATNTATAKSFTVTAVGGTPAGGIYSQVVTGPDAALTGTACAAAGGATFTCTVTPAAGPGTDSLRFFYDATSNVYQASDPTATASLTVAGPISKIVLAPSTSSVAAGARTTYTATATDAAGRPVISSQIKLTATEPNTANGDLEALSPPSTGSMTVATPTPSTTPGSATVNAFTNDGSTGTAGVASFSVASRSVGSVAVSVLSLTNPAVGGSAVLTVNGGTNNDATLVSIAPTTQHAFTTATAYVTVNVQNMQGNPIPGVTPVASVISGPNSGAVVTVGASDANGNSAASYPAAGTQGQDIVQAFVNYTGGTSGLDSGEPSAKATVNVATPDVTSIVDNGGTGFTVPLSANSTTITYTVKNTGGSLAGYNLRFAPTSPLPAGTQGTFTLSASSAVTDASGNASVTVTNANPANGDNTSVSASIGNGANLKTDAVTVRYAASAVSASGIKITPFANTTTGQGTAAFSVAAVDQFGQPVTGLSFNWTVTGRNSTANNAGAQGSGSTFSYTDAGAANSAGTDVVTVVTRNGNTVVGNTVADQYWVTTAATSTQANIDLGTGGVYTTTSPGAGQTGPVVASGFTTSSTAGVTADPSPGVVPAVQTVRIKLTDAANNRLYGKSVSLTSGGVGVFTDLNGKPLGTSTTALVADPNVVANYPGTTVDNATAYVRSTQGGTQTITAKVDGITTTATVTYSGQFVGVTPVRVMDTRSGQGAIQVNGTTAPAGPLAPNTSYTFGYAAAGMPVGAAAYAFNVTAVKPSGVGNLRVAPGTGTVAPTTSLVNYQSGKDVANFVIVPNNAAAGLNFLQLYSAASSADVAIDFVGSYPTAGSVTPTTPSRIADTRNGGTPVAVGETRSFQVAGLGGLPGTTAKAVALNVTVVNPSSLGNLRIFADGDAVPTTSNINYIPGQDKSAYVIVNLPANGKISVYSAGTPVDVAIDAFASFDTVTSNVVTQTPVRILDTRITGNPIAANGVQDLQVVGTAGIPATAQAVLVSVTGIHTAGSLGSGNLGVFPSGGAVPIISTLNYVSPTSDVANFAIVKLGANGKITIDSMGSPTDVAVDVLGYVPAG